MLTRGSADVASPWALLGWRFTIAFVAALVCVLTGLMKIDLKGKSIKPLIGIALLYPVLYFIGETYGVYLTSASESAVLIACIPIGAVIASSLILKEKPGTRQLSGIITTVAGVMITVFAVSASVSFSVIGYMCLLGAIVFYSLYSVQVEKATEYSSAELTFVMLAAGALAYGTAAVIEAAHNGDLTGLVTLPLVHHDFAFTVIYEGVGCSMLAFFLTNITISKIGASRNASFSGISTAISIMTGILILHEQFNALQFVGVVVIIVGVYIANSMAERNHD
ncbi:MAG: DMT family transporter [Clostridiales bacterium]|nr:DMT family transporter [Candidatus Crickella equi]